MTSTESATTFTESLLQIIRQQRHLATRVIIATQEPTISPKLLSLSTMTIVHRFTSPEWLNTLKSHLAGVSPFEDGRSLKHIFKQIVGLEAGEALLFCPNAMVGFEDVSFSENEGGLSKNKLRGKKLGTGYMKIRARRRLTADGGRSIMMV
jgi:hypothetical protein